MKKMVRKKTIWIAETGKYPQEFENRKDADATEEKYNLDRDILKLDNTFRKYFKRNFKEKKSSNRCLYLCVDCGIKLIEYERNYDGHRNKIGDIVYRHNEQIITFLDGNRCENCDKKALELFTKMVHYYDNKNKTMSIIGKNWKYTYDKNKKDFLYILKIVESWDKDKNSRQ